MAACLGGTRITKMQWDGRRALAVTFTSVFADRLYQLYAGRTRIAVTELVSELRMVGQLEPTDCPAPLQIVAVEPSDVGTLYGSELPPRPWNRYRAGWSAEDYPADAKWFELWGSSAASEPADTLIARVQYVGDTDYVFDLPPLTAGGAWEYTITPLDDAVPAGNAGTPSTLTVNAHVHPPDVSFLFDGNRFSLAVADGVLTASFTF